MKMIQAIIKPQKLEDVKNALGQIGILGATAIEVKGFGRQLGHTERYRGAKMDIGFVPKVLLEVVVKESDLNKAIEAITNGARTGMGGQKTEAGVQRIFGNDRVGIEE